MKSDAFEILRHLNNIIDQINGFAGYENQKKFLERL